jgi:tetratricopeptide (TPR) repeat protein
MSQRLQRKDIKHDDFAESLGRGVEYVGGHAKAIGLGIVAVLVAIAAGVGIYFYLGARAEKANAALGAALKVATAPISATDATPDDPVSPSFATEAARDQRARELLEKVRSEYGASDAADFAGLHLADMAVRTGDLQRARDLWSDFVDDQGDHLLSGQARLNLLALERREGKGEEVLTRLKGWLDQSEPPLPKDVILNELALTLEALERNEEAKQYYRQIVDDYPQSPYRAEAQQKSGSGGGLPGGMSLQPFSGLPG